MDYLRDLSKEQLKNLLVNWYRRAKGKYKVPVFAHQELDLHKVFWEVQDRGGYDHVTAHKLWKVGLYISDLVHLPLEVKICALRRHFELGLFACQMNKGMWILQIGHAWL